MDSKELQGYALAVDMLREQGLGPLGDPPRSDRDYMSEDGGHLTPRRPLPFVVACPVKRCATAVFISPFWFAWVIDHPILR